MVPQATLGTGRHAIVANRLLLHRPATAAALELFERARAGHGGTLFVVGHAGVGKTEFLEATIGLVQRELQVASAQGDRLETMMPMGLLAQLAEGLGEAPVIDPPTGSPAAPASAATRCYAALRWLRERATEPTLLAIDDLHWSDVHSLAVLAFLCRRIRRLPVAVVATMRRWPPTAEEICLHLADRGHARLERLTPRLETPNGTRPLSCLLGLPETGRRCAAAATVLGSPFEYEVAAMTAGLDAAEARSALEALCRSGVMVQSARGTMEFADPGVRQALFEAIAPPIRDSLQRRALAVVATRVMPPSTASSGIPNGRHPQHAADRLTDREQRVAGLAANGLSNRDLATQLSVSVNTIETHLKRVYAKLGIGSRRQLIAMARHRPWPGSLGGSALRLP